MAPLLSGSGSTRPTTSLKVGATSSLLRELCEVLPWFCYPELRAAAELLLDISFAGSFHSDTTPDQACHGLTPLTHHEPPLLFDLESDPAENYNLVQSAAGPQVWQILKDIKLQKTLFEQRMEFGESQMKKGGDPALEPCCKPDCTPKPSCCCCS